MEEKYKPLFNNLLAKLNVIKVEDPAHDGSHTQRVTTMAIMIAEKENADLEIIIPAALFHDAVVHRKDNAMSEYSTEMSASVAKTCLANLDYYPKQKINHVVICIEECSYSKGLPPSTLESKILQDADRLEATGAIAIMRTFSSGGQMNRPFYNPSDPFREDSSPGGTEFSLDLLYKRLLLVAAGMHTQTAKTIAKRRHEFLKMFEDELRIELGETGAWKNPPTSQELRTEWYQKRHDWMS